jgi:hypothetical protein
MAYFGTRTYAGDQPLVRRPPAPPTTQTGQPYTPWVGQQPIERQTPLDDTKGFRPPVGPVQPNPGVPPNPFQPPSAQPPAAGGNPQQNISDELMKQLMSFIGNPSRYNQDVVDSRFAHQREVLGKGFDVQRQKNLEDASRRGTFYSTEPSGRNADIGGQQALAESDLLSNLTTDQAKTHGEDMQRAINTILGFGSQQFGQQQATAQMNMLQDQQMRDFLLQLLGGSS